MATNARPIAERSGRSVEQGREHEPEPGEGLPSSYQLDGGKDWADLMAGKRAGQEGREGKEQGRDGGERRTTPEAKELVDAIGAYFEKADQMSGISEGRVRDLGMSPEYQAKQREELGQARERVEQAMGLVRAQGREMSEREAEPRVGDDTRPGDMRRIKVQALGQEVDRMLKGLPGDRDG